MNIYRAINNVYMGVSLREFDSEGNLLAVHEVEFTNGSQSPKFEGGALATKDPVLIKLLNESPRNKANGGDEWYLEREIKEEKNPKQTATAPKESVKEVVPETPQAEPEPEEEATPESSEVQVYADITTAQAASQILRGLNPKLKVTEVRSKAQINAVAAQMNISFPNL